MSTGFNKIREWLLPQLDKKGISIEQFARAAGISRAAIYFYMDDTHRPSTQMMARRCHWRKD
jgi:predicted DNA-binding transcriptional regulator AlpA